jgi:hypothetical protein
MASTRRFFKVFLASPSDLAEERVAAKDVVDEYNSQLAEKLGYHAELVGWEDTLPGMGRPQALINRDLDGCDLFVGMLWKRWGTPPDESGIYSSGFEEEFRLSTERFEREQRPQIHLLLKDVDSSALVDPGDQLKRVQEFKKVVFSERKLLAKSFADLSTFERSFRQCIQGFAISLGDREAVQEPQRSKTAESEPEPPDEMDAIEGYDSALSSEGVSFLKGLLSQLRQQNNYSPTAVEIARFRLLSTVLSAQGNDETSLAAHDSNILFRHRKELVLSRKEQVALIYAGLDNYKSENVPLWHWVASVSASTPQILVFSSIVGPSAPHKAAAISAMRLIGTSIEETEFIRREHILSIWYSNDSASIIRAAATSYLADWGTIEDIDLLRSESERGDYQTEKGAMSAILSILIRETPDKAFPWLMERSPATIDRRLLDDLLRITNPPNDLLMKGLEQRNGDLRVLVATELRKRKALTATTAERLLDDEDVRVRYEAMMALASNGKGMTADQAKARLTPKQKTSHGLNLRIMENNEADADMLLDSYLLDQKTKLPQDELREEANEVIFDQLAFIALVRKDPAQFGEALRFAVRDEFKSRFTSALSHLSEKHNWQDNFVAKIRNLEVHLRREFTRAGLDWITIERRSHDLGLVRQVIGSGFVDYSAGDIAYLKRFGDWQDIPAIVASLDRPNARGVCILHSSFTGDRTKEVAQAIYELARNRIADVSSLELPAYLLTQLIALLPLQRVREIPVSQLAAWFTSQDATLRKAVALKAVSALSRRAIDKLLSEQLNANQFYYNVIYWLDYGVSVPREAMLRGCGRALREL